MCMWLTQSTVLLNTIIIWIYKGVHVCTTKTINSAVSYYKCYQLIGNVTTCIGSAQWLVLVLLVSPPMYMCHRRLHAAVLKGPRGKQITPLVSLIPRSCPVLGTRLPLVSSKVCKSFKQWKNQESINHKLVLGYTNCNWNNNAVCVLLW